LTSNDPGMRCRIASWYPLRIGAASPLIASAAARVPKSAIAFCASGWSWVISPRRTAHNIRSAHRRFSDVSFFRPPRLMLPLTRAATGYDRGAEELALTNYSEGSTVVAIAGSKKRSGNRFRESVCASCQPDLTSRDPSPPFPRHTEPPQRREALGPHTEASGRDIVHQRPAHGGSEG
jgi:hypothetical protein